MKPASIRKFDWLYWASVIIGLSGLAIGWDTINAQVSSELAATGDEELGSAITSGAIIVGAVVGAAISIAIWFLISVLRIELGKWVLIAMVLWTLVTLPGGIELAGGFSLMHVPSIVSTALTIAAIWFLFQPDAKAWFAEKRTGRPED